MTFTGHLHIDGAPSRSFERHFYLSGCDEFTVDSCRPDPSQIINAGYLPNQYDQNDKEGTCQNFCDRQTDCTYWSVYCPRTPGSEHCNCTLYGHSYLHSCQKVGGDKDTAIEVSLRGDRFQINKLTKLGRCDRTAELQTAGLLILLEE